VKYERNPAKAGIEAAESTASDVCSGLSEEYDSEREAADFDEYVSECVPEGYYGSQRRRWMASFCRAAGERAAALYRARTSEWTAAVMPKGVESTRAHTVRCGRSKRRTRMEATQAPRRRPTKHRDSYKRRQFD